MLKLFGVNDAAVGIVILELLMPVKEAALSGSSSSAEAAPSSTLLPWVPSLADCSSEAVDEIVSPSRQ